MLPTDALVNYVFPNNMQIWWELPIVIYPYITGLIAGAFVVSSLYHVFKIEDFKSVANFALVASFCFGLFAGTPLLTHLGQPQRAWEIFVTPHTTSAMSVFGYVYAGYMLLLTIELWVVYRTFFIQRANETAGLGSLVWRILALGLTTDNPEPERVDHRVISILAGIGIPWAFLLHGYVGFIFGSVKAISWWATALQPIIFLSSAVVSGMAILVLMYTFICWRTRRPYEFPMIRRLIAILFAVFVIDWALEILEIVHVSYQRAHEWSVIKPLLLGPLSGSYIVWQIVILSATPVLMIAYAVLITRRDKVMLILANLASFLLLMQVLFMRFNVVIGGQMISKSDRGFTEFEWEFFSREGVIVVAILFIEPFVAYYIISRFIPVFGDARTKGGAGEQA